MFIDTNRLLNLEELARELEDIEIIRVEVD